MLGGGVKVNKIRNMLRGKSLKGLMGEEKNPVFDLRLDSQPANM